MHCVNIKYRIKYTCFKVPFFSGNNVVILFNAFAQAFVEFPEDGFPLKTIGAFFFVKRKKKRKCRATIKIIRFFSCRCYFISEHYKCYCR